MIGEADDLRKLTVAALGESLLGRRKTSMREPFDPTFGSQHSLRPGFLLLVTS